MMGRLVVIFLKQCVNRSCSSSVFLFTYYLSSLSRFMPRCLAWQDPVELSQYTCLTVGESEFNSQ
jgi:hypothetical protein